MALAEARILYCVIVLKVLVGKYRPKCLHSDALWGHLAGLQEENSYIGR